MGSPDIREIIRKSVQEKSTDAYYKYRRSLPDFAQYVFKDPQGDPIQLQPFHFQMFEMMENLRRVLILAPRGSGKSSLASLIYPCFRIMQNRDIRIIIVSNTIDLAQEWLRSIERTMTQNEEYIRLSGGDFVPDNKSGVTWTNTEKVIKGRSSHATHLTLKAVGVKGSLLGKRADLIIVDDVVDPDNAATPYQRQLVSNWFHQVLMPILDPKGKVIVIGTRFARGDLYEELWDQWTKVDVNGKPVVRGSGVLKIVAVPEEGVSYWPERFPYEDLNAIKLTNSMSFYSQYQNEPVDFFGAFLKGEWLEHWYTEDTLPKHPDGGRNLNYYVGMDPSITGKGDSTGICVIGCQPGSTKMYVMEIIREKADLARQTELLEEINLKYKPVLVNVEANAAQQIIVQFLEKETKIPIHMSTTRLDKAARFATLAGHFQNGRILLKGTYEDGKMTHHEEMWPIVEEWIGFRPKDARDDAIDALEKAVEIAAFVTDPYEEVYNPSPRETLQQNFNKRRNFRLLR